MPEPGWKHLGMGGWVKKTATACPLACQGQCSLSKPGRHGSPAAWGVGVGILLPICPRASTFMVWRAEVTLFPPSLLTQQSLHCPPIA